LRERATSAAPLLKILRERAASAAPLLKILRERATSAAPLLKILRERAASAAPLLKILRDTQLEDKRGSKTQRSSNANVARKPNAARTQTWLENPTQLEGKNLAECIKFSNVHTVSFIDSASRISF
jgi:hypothetical protein